MGWHDPQTWLLVSNSLMTLSTSCQQLRRTSSETWNITASICPRYTLLHIALIDQGVQCSVANFNLCSFIQSWTPSKDAGDGQRSTQGRTATTAFRNCRTPCQEPWPSCPWTWSGSTSGRSGTIIGPTWRGKQQLMQWMQLNSIGLIGEFQTQRIDDN